MDPFAREFARLSRARIGSVVLASRIILAPMRRVSHFAFRMICKENGAGLTYTECVNSAKLLARLRGGGARGYVRYRACERPIAAQLSGSDPSAIADAAAHVSGLGFELIDLNCGCPFFTDGGARLLRNPERIRRIIEAVRQAAPSTPVTVKIRSGWDARHVNAPEIAQLAAEAGVSAVTVHARTADQGYSGTADWEVIARVKEAVTIPVIGNGDVFSPAAAKALMQQTRCDLVMIGRGAFGNPWIFQATNDYLRTGALPPPPSRSQRYQMYGRYLLWSARHLDFPDGPGAAGIRHHALTQPTTGTEWGHEASPLARSRLWKTWFVAANLIKKHVSRSADH